MAVSNLDFEGVYDKTKRFMVHNWSPEDFTQRYGAESALKRQYGVKDYRELEEAWRANVLEARK